MKNFTKQNFKTNPLWIRLLIMAFMLLLGSSSAWAAKWTVYFVNKDKWSTVKIHHWKDGGSSTTWPGADMTKTSNSVLGYNVYSFNADDDHNKCIFNNGSGAQTGDLDINNGKYYYNGTWYSSISEIEEAATLPFLMGTLTDWDKGVKMTSSSSNVYTCTVNLTSSSTNYEFKIKYQDKWYGNTEVITSTISGWVFAENANNCRLKANKDGDYTFTFNTSDKKVSVTFPPDCIAEKDVTPGEVNVKPANDKYCAGEDYQLSINPTAIGGYTTTIQWQKKDGNNYSDVSTNTSLNLEGLAAGTYTYRATVTWTKGACTVTESTVDKSFTVNELPAAPEFNAAPSYCAGDVITLPAEDKEKNSVTWYKEDGTAAGTPANTEGTYIYKAKATNTNGCVSSDYGTYSYTVKSVPAVNDFEYTEPDNLTYDRSAKEASVTWESGTGSGDITIYYKVAGATGDTYTTDAPIAARTYTVAVTAIEGGNYCATTGYVVVGEFTINKANQTTPTITAESNICGKEATFTVSGGESTGDYVYSFYKNDAGATREGTTLKATKSGSVTLKVKKAQDANYNESAEVTKEFNFTMPIENVKLTKADSKTTYCTGDVVRIKLTYDGPTVTDINKFKWNGAVEGQVSIANVTGGMASGVEFDVTCISGENEISVALTDCSGEKPSNELEINVSPLPSAPTLTTNTTNVCPGTLTLSNFKAMAETNTVKWYSNDACTQEIAVQTVEEGKTYTFYAKAINANGCVSEGYSTLTVKVYAKPDDFEMSAIPAEICSGENVVISISDKQEGVTYTLGKTEINESITVKPTQTTTYTVVASLDACPALTNSISTTEIVVNPIPSFVTPPSNLSLCKGATNVTDLTDLSHVEVANGLAVWYDAQTGGNAVAGANLETGGTYTYWVAAENSTTGCINPERKQFTLTINELPKYPELGKRSASLCQSNETEDLDKLAEINDVVWYIGENEVNNAHTISLATAGTTIYTAKAVDANGCQSATGAEFVLTIDAQPTFTAPAATQTNKEVKLTSAAGASTQWSVTPTENVTLTDNDDGTATFVATANGDYTITASNGVCAPVSHTIKVSDAFYIWVRNAKESDTAYGQFYFPNENTEAVRGGEMFYAECDALPTQDNYKSYNEGGRKADVVQNDCDGYTWYGFKASEEVISGTKYFYVHATNDISKGGYFTHSVPLKVTMSADLYYTLGEDGNSYWGWNLATASAPYAGPMVHASGDAKFNLNNFADFVSLYVTDCSGKTVKSYQWEFCRTQAGKYESYSSECTYKFEKKDVVKTETGNAGKSNNIRTKTAGYYRCVVTYDDDTSKTSESIQVSTGASTPTALASFESNLPIIMVNTNGKGFPDCTGISEQTASRNASKFKAKRSVDVKIYEGETLVYDRKARMNYRGSSSLNFVKKSYAFCPGDANCGDKDKGEDYVKTAKLNMLGVGKACDKDWVLYAAAADPSLMRNRLVFDSYKAMTGKWGVNSRYVELIVDGVYKGVYVFMDKITMNTERVKVDEDKGFIVKFDKTDREDRVGGLNGVLGDEKTFKTSYTGKDDIRTYDTDIDQRFEIEYPEKDDYTTGWKARVDGIQGMFQAFEDALKQGDYATVQKYIDYTSWADWFIINEYTKNVDAYRASCIFVYTGEAGAKIEARPLWDQELSFNNQASNGTNNKGSNSTTGLLIQHSNVYSDSFKAPFWFTGGSSDIEGGLLSDPCFVQVVKERWNMHQSSALSKKSLEDLVDEYEDELAPEGTTENALTRETAFWDGKSRGTCDCSYETSNATATGYQNKTFEESTGTITNWIADGAGGRREGLTTAINGLTGASFSIQIIPSVAYTTPWEPVEIAVSVTPAGYDYKLEYTGVNNLGGVANTIIKEEGDKIIYRIPRPDDWETGDELVEGERTDIEYGIKATLSVQEGTTVCGSQAAPSSTGKIILQDEDNDNCK